jgi:hypothetical protein
MPGRYRKFFGQEESGEKKAAGGPGKPCRAWPATSRQSRLAPGRFAFSGRRAKTLRRPAIAAKAQPGVVLSVRLFDNLKTPFARPWGLSPLNGLNSHDWSGFMKTAAKYHAKSDHAKKSRFPSGHPPGPGPGTLAEGRFEALDFATLRTCYYSRLSGAMPLSRQCLGAPLFQGKAPWARS